MPIILRLIAMGVPAAKIIAKYGKKAYNAAKKLYKTKNKTDLVGDIVIGGGSVGSAAIIAMMAKEKIQKDKKKKIRTETRKAQRGTKIYSKGSIVRKPRSY